MATYPEGFEPIKLPDAAYPEGFEPLPAAASPVVTTGTDSPATDRGGLGVPVTRQEAIDISAKRMVARARAAGQWDLLTKDEANELAARAGIPGLREDQNLVSLNDADSPFVKALMGTSEFAGAAGLGLGPAIRKVVEDVALNDAQQQIFGQTALRERMPAVTSGAQALGSLVPAGSVARAATAPVGTLRQALSGAGQGLRLGTTVGAAGQVAETGTDTTLSDLIQSAAVGGGIGTAVGAGAPLAARGIQESINALIRAPGAIARAPAAVAEQVERFQTRNAPATVQQSAMAALDFTEPQVQQHIPIVTQRVQEIVKKQPKNAQEALKFINDAENALYNERKAANTLAEEEGLVVRGNDALQAATDVLNAIPTITQRQRDEILRELTPVYRGNKSPIEGQAIQQRLNKEFKAQYENGTFDKAAPLNEAKLAIRDSFATQMDEIHKLVTGVDETPYSDIGSLIEVGGALQDKITKLSAREAATKTGIETRPSSLPATKFQALNRARRTLLTPFQKNQLERLDDNIVKVFKESPTQPAGRQLTEDELNMLRYKFSVSPEETLQDQIERLVNSYPAEIRANPALARRIAEAEIIPPQAPVVPPSAAPSPLLEAPVAPSPAPSILENIAPVESFNVRVGESPAAPIKTYSPEIQRRLDEAQARYQERVNFYKNQQINRDIKDKNLKGAAMRFAAEKRQITGELTPKEAAAIRAREATNYVGKDVNLNLAGEIIPAKIIGNPFGRVKVLTNDGRELIVSQETILPLNPAQ